MKLGDGQYKELNVFFVLIDRLIVMPPKLKVRPPKDDEGGPSPNDGPSDVAVNINRRSKLTGVPPGVPPPNDGPSDVTVNINRRSKLTEVPPGVPPPSDGCASGGVSCGAKGGVTLAASARGCVGADVSFAETIGAPTQPSIEAPTQPSMYLDSLSALEQHVCRIAESHLESSFDLSRSTGYIAWKAKNGI